MNNSWKGACLSGLVYPGLGQLVQRHYARGIALAGTVSASLVVIVMKVSAKIGDMLAGMETGSIDLDVTSIMREMDAFSAGRDYQVMKTASTLILLCWVIGIADAYLSGRRLDPGAAAGGAIMAGDGKTTKGRTH